jgi:hypothetical protein
MSEPNGQGTDSGAALGQLAADARLDPESPASNDAWFDPGPKPHGYQPLDADAMDAAGWPAGSDGPDRAAAQAPADSRTGQRQGAGADGDAAADPEEWFLRTGRAGLLPDSITESWDDEDTHVFARPDTAAAPPWAGDQPEHEVEEPPPWESEPWPGPGEARPARQPRPSQPRILNQPGDDADNWQSVAALIAGIAPLVVPGVVLGVLGLRRARSTGTGRMTSWLGICCSAIWAVVLIVLLASSGGSGAGCPASTATAVGSAVTTVRHDLSGAAQPSTLKTDLVTAISQANSAAAAVQQVQARSAFLVLTTELQRTLAIVQAGRSASQYAALSTQLGSGSAAVTSACGS